MGFNHRELTGELEGGALLFQANRHDCKPTFKTFVLRIVGISDKMHMQTFCDLLSCIYVDAKASIYYLRRRFEIFRELMHARGCLCLQ